MTPGSFSPTLIAGNGYSWAFAVMNGTAAVDTTNWDVKLALREAYTDSSPALLLTVGSGITVGNGTDNEVVIATITDTQTATLISGETYAASTPYHLDMTVLLDGASDWSAFMRGAATLEAAATRLGEPA